MVDSKEKGEMLQSQVSVDDDVLRFSSDSESDADLENSRVEEVSLETSKKQAREELQRGQLEIRKLKLLEKKRKLERRSKIELEKEQRKIRDSLKKSVALPSDLLEAAEIEVTEPTLDEETSNRHLKVFDPLKKSRGSTQTSRKLSFLDTHYLYKKKIQTGLEVAVLSTVDKNCRLSPMALQAPDSRVAAFGTLPQRTARLASTHTTIAKLGKSRVLKATKRTPYVKAMALKHGGALLAKNFVRKSKAS